MRPCVPSQYGLFAEPPQRQSENARPSSTSIALPCGSVIFVGPVTRYGPFGMT